MFNLNDRQMNNELERRRDEEHCGSTNDYGQFNEYYDDYCPEDECIDDYTADELEGMPVSIRTRLQPSKKVSKEIEDIFNAEYDAEDNEEALELFNMNKRTVSQSTILKEELEMTTTIERVPYKVVGTVIGKNDRVLGTKEFWTTTSDGTKAIENVKKRVRRSGLLLTDPQSWRNPAKETVEEVAEKVIESVKPVVGKKGWTGGLGLGIGKVTVRGNERDVQVTKVFPDGAIIGMVGKAWFKFGIGEVLPCVKISYKPVSNQVRVLVMEFIEQRLIDVTSK